MDKIKAELKKIKMTDLTTIIIGFLILHFILTMINVIVLNETNAFISLYEQGKINTYISISSLVGSLPYFIIGYLLVLARNDNKDLNQQIECLSIIILGILLVLFVMSYLFQLIKPFRVSYKTFVLFNYPASRYLVAMNILKDGNNILIALSALFPPLFVWLGGKARIKRIEVNPHG